MIKEFPCPVDVPLNELSIYAKVDYIQSMIVANISANYNIYYDH